MGTRTKAGSLAPPDKSAGAGGEPPSRPRKRTRRSTAPSAPSSAPSSVARASGDRRVVAVTGAFGSLGRRVLALLEEDPDVERVVAVDVKPAFAGASSDARAYLEAHAKLSAHALDLTEAGVDVELARIFQNERVGSVLHLAFLSTPTHALEMAHELETIGTLYVLSACAAANVSAIVSLSSSMCYGAHPDNPAWITEAQPLRPPSGSRSLTDKAEADRAVLRFGDEHPSTTVATARVGAVLGSAPDHFWTRTFARPVVPAVLGYDPLLQLMLVDDAARGVVSLWKSRVKGPVNLVGKGVLPLSHVLTRLGRAPLYLPGKIGASVVGALWSAQLIDMPRQYLDFLRWSFVCDGERARAECGFVAEHDIATVLGVFGATRSSLLSSRGAAA